MNDIFAPAPEPPAGRSRWGWISLVLLVVLALVSWLMMTDVGRWIWPSGSASEAPPKTPATPLPTSAPPAYPVKNRPVDIEDTRLPQATADDKSTRERELEHQVKLLTEAIQRLEAERKKEPAQTPIVKHDRGETAEQRRARLKAEEQERKERERELKAWKPKWGTMEPIDAEAEGQMQSLKTPYSLPPGWEIHCRTKAKISNESAGSFIAYVDRPVKDVTGRHIVIPQGSMIVNEPTRQAIYGDDRFGVTAKTLTFPNGDYIGVQDSSMGDQMGTPGFADQIDRHYFRIFTAALITGALRGGSTALYGYTGGVSDRATGGAVQETTGEMSRQMQQFMRTDPTHRIRPSYGCVLLLTEELVLTHAWDAYNQPIP